MGYPLRGVPEPESVTEHSWHVAFLVWSLAPSVPGLDLSRALTMALIHDLAEVRIGDLPQISSHYFPPGAKKAAEAAAAAELLAPVAESALDLIADYQRAESLEARLVKACDKLQVMVKAAVYERWGAGGLAEFWDNPANFTDGGFEGVRELYDELRARRRATLETSKGSA